MSAVNVLEARQLCACLLTVVLAAACGSGPVLGNSSLWVAPSVGPQADVPAEAHADAAAEPEAAADGEPVAKAVQTLANADQAEACTTLCYLTNKYCQKASLVYASLDECRADCLELPAVGEVGTSSGNTVQCRITFALLSRRIANMAFCRDASRPGGDRCHD